MALGVLQREICRLLADRRIEAGESYLAGGSTVSELIGASRLSRDIDIFRDTETAVRSAFQEDRDRLLEAGFEVEIIRDWRGFVEAEVRRAGERVRIDWARGSSYRFFPLVRHDELGLVLHPFDLATNKMLALVGRLEPRDWVDVIECDRRLQPFGFLAWAACGKDPGFSPPMLVEHAARTGRYSEAELGGLDFSTPPPDAAALARRWHDLIDEVRRVVERLPGAEAGSCVLDARGELCRSGASELPKALAAREVRFHPGRIGGALPTIHPG